MNDIVERARLPGKATHAFQQEMAAVIERQREELRVVLMHVEELRAEIARLKETIVSGR